MIAIIIGLAVGVRGPIINGHRLKSNSRKALNTRLYVYIS